MSADPRLERALPGILADLGAGAAPDYVDSILGRTAATRQRPAWIFPGRWLPMSVVTTRVATAPPVRWRTVAVLALLIVALAAATVFVVGSQQRKLPAPFGPAANGVIAYASAGDIFVGDPAAGTTMAIVTGIETDTRPVFSPDGTRVAFLRDAGRGTFDIVVVDADGSDPRTITTLALSGIGDLGWSPDSASVVVEAAGVLEMMDADQAAEPRLLSDRLVLGRPADGVDSQVDGSFRPPAGDQVLYIGMSGGTQALFVKDADGSNTRTLIDGSTPGVGGSVLESPVWSPDGSMIAFAASVDRDASNWRPPMSNMRVFVMNADGSGLRRLSRETRALDEVYPAWSPDGSRIAVLRRSYDLVDDWPYVSFRPITVVDVESGGERELGAAQSVAGLQGWAWSPDGRSILALPNQGTRLKVVDVATGEGRELAWDAGSAASWQRVKP